MMKTWTRLTFRWEGIDISDEIELLNGKSNPFGWSQREVWYGGERIGGLECGIPFGFREIEGFTCEETEEPIPEVTT